MKDGHHECNNTAMNRYIRFNMSLLSWNPSRCSTFNDDFNFSHSSGKITLPAICPRIPITFKAINLKKTVKMLLLATKSSFVIQYASKEFYKNRIHTYGPLLLKTWILVSYFIQCIHLLGPSNQSLLQSKTSIRGMEHKKQLKTEKPPQN